MTTKTRTARRSRATGKCWPTLLLFPILACGPALKPPPESKTASSRKPTATVAQTTISTEVYPFQCDYSEAKVASAIAKAIKGRVCWLGEDGAECSTDRCERRADAHCFWQGESGQRDDLGRFQCADSALACDRLRSLLAALGAKMGEKNKVASSCRRIAREGSPRETKLIAVDKTSGIRRHLSTTENCSLFSQRLNLALETQERAERMECVMP